MTGTNQLLGYFQRRPRHGGPSRNTLGTYRPMVIRPWI